jgi:hypothetical protein
MRIWHVGMQTILHHQIYWLPELLSERAVARGEGTFRKVNNQYKKFSLLILDEWMLATLTETRSKRSAGNHSCPPEKGIYYLLFSVCSCWLVQQVH